MTRPVKSDIRGIWDIGRGPFLSLLEQILIIWRNRMGQMQHGDSQPIFQLFVYSTKVPTSTIMWTQAHDYGICGGYPIYSVTN